MIATTKPVYNGNKLRIERRRAAGQFGESVLDELMCDLSIPVRITCIQDHFLEVKENQHHQECRCSCDNGDDYGIFGVLTRAINVCSTHGGECPDLLLNFEPRPPLVSYRMRQ